MIIVKASINSRPADLQYFLNELQAAFAGREQLPGVQRAFCAKLFGALGKAGTPGQETPVALPVCEHMPAALHASKSNPAVSSLAATLERIAPSLAWKRRASGGPHASLNWPESHANAVIVGQGGLEQRDDVAIGVSLLAPHVRYPDHTHPPEELYMILSPGRFQHGDEAWCEPGPGGTFHNVPAIKHAMASEGVPLLAIWTMLVDP